MQIGRVIVSLLLAGGYLTQQAQGQLDPDKRELFQFGYNQPLEGHAPLSAYAFYYLNVPDFAKTNLYLRLAVAPVYLDSEVGLKGLLGQHTDLGLGLSGGGFADSYNEIRQGEYLQGESFIGHGGGPSASVYHLFNPGRLVPLYGLVRGEAHYSTYAPDSSTEDNFVLPEDHTTFSLRSGLRWGGRAPYVLPDVAMEISVWYEGQYRTDNGPYGFGGDRRLNTWAHQFWSRALLTYTLPHLKHNFNLNLTVGTSLNADRFSAYRLGGLLPLSSEFPLSLPGYYFQEISARNFALIGGSYSIPLDPKKRWAVTAAAATAGVDYLAGLQQPGNWLSGVGGGISYRSPKEAWTVVLSYGYGIDAIRSHGRGANAVGILVQFDLERANVALFEPGESPMRSRGLERIWNKINPF